MADGDGVCHDTHNAECYYVYRGPVFIQMYENDTMCYSRRDRAKLDFSILLLSYIQSYSQLGYLGMKTSYN